MDEQFGSLEPDTLFSEEHMKTDVKVFLFCLMLFVMLAASCGQSTESLDTPSSTMSILSTGSNTPTPSFTPLPTASPTLIPSATAIPTLPLEEAQTKLLQLLSNNGGCRLPCLWNIVPGESTYQEAQAILSPLSGISELTGFRPEGGAIFPVYTEGDLTLYTIIGFNVNSLPDNQIVKRVGFNAEAHRLLAQGGYEDVFDSKFFGEKVSAYSLSYVLTEQGIPSAVLISTMAGPPTRGGKAGFYMVLLYPDQGILVSYTTNWQNRSGNALGCFQNAHVEMELYPSGQGDSFSEFLAPTKWSGMWPVPVESPYWKPIEKATAMSLEQFYEIFRQPTEKCIETPINLWPTPEP
jgi:hypothetical protein